MVFGGIMLKKQEDPEAVNDHSWGLLPPTSSNGFNKNKKKGNA